MHNPGTIPDQRLTNSLTDVTVVFEESFNTYQSRQNALEALPANRSAYSYMVHSLPAGYGYSDLESYVNKLCDGAEFLFLTNLSQDYYANWGSSWNSFVNAITSASKA